MAIDVRWLAFRGLEPNTRLLRYRLNDASVVGCRTQQLSAFVPNIANRMGEWELDADRFRLFQKKSQIFAHQTCREARVKCAR